MSLLSGLVVDQAAARAFWSSADVRAVVEETAAELIRRGTTDLLAVSGEGERLVGALLFARPEAFTVWSRGEQGTPALVDGVTASLLAAQAAARRHDLVAPVIVVLKAPNFEAGPDRNVVAVPISPRISGPHLAAV